MMFASQRSNIRITIIPEHLDLMYVQNCNALLLAVLAIAVPHPNDGLYRLPIGG